LFKFRKIEPETMVLVCPAVLVLEYFRGGSRHLLMLAFALDGSKAQVVGLRIGKTWSGWHGYWMFNAHGGPRGSHAVGVNCKGNESRLVHLFIAPIFTCETYWLKWKLQCAYKHIVFTMLGVQSKVMTQRQLANIVQPPVWLDVDGWALIT
jgi:hypothetical protein